MPTETVVQLGCADSKGISTMPVLVQLQSDVIYDNIEKNNYLTKKIQKYTKISKKVKEK